MEKASKFIEETVKSLVTNPDDVALKIEKDDGGVLVSLSVNKKDMGLVIGKKGETIMAIRSLAKCIAAKEKAIVRIKLEEPETHDNTGTSPLINDDLDFL